MNTPTTVTNATARLNMESVNRLIENEVNFATANLRGENQSLRLRLQELELRASIGSNRHAARLERDGQIMVIIAIGCGIAGLLAGYFIAEVLMR
jgi:hypothetical protein